MIHYRNSANLCFRLDNSLPAHNPTQFDRGASVNFDALLGGRWKGVKSFDQNHLSGFNKTTCLKLVEVNSARQLGPIQPDLVDPGRSLFIHQHGYLAAEEIVYYKLCLRTPSSNLPTPRYRKRNGRARVEGVRVILLQRVIIWMGQGWFVTDVDPQRICERCIEAAHRDDIRSQLADATDIR